MNVLGIMAAITAPYIVAGVGVFILRLARRRRPITRSLVKDHTYLKR